MLRASLQYKIGNETIKKWLIPYRHPTLLKIPAGIFFT